MNPRHSDGTFRGPKQPAKLSEASIKARWIEAEALALRKLWISYRDIATHITKVGRGEEKAIQPLPEGLVFPPNYSISTQAVQQKVVKALAREGAMNVEEFRQLAIAQSEESLKYLQPAIRKGDTKAISTSTKVMGFVAKLNGAYGTAKSAEALKQNTGKPPLAELLEAIGLSDDEVQEERKVG
jgi:hypothetical protein